MLVLKEINQDSKIPAPLLPSRLAPYALRLMPYASYLTPLAYLYLLMSTPRSRARASYQAISSAGGGASSFSGLRTK